MHVGKCSGVKNTEAEVKWPQKNLQNTPSIYYDWAINLTFVAERFAARARTAQPRLSSAMPDALPVQHRPLRAKTILEAIRCVIDEGCDSRLVQKTPHIVLLSRKFYHEKLMPLLAQWILLWMRQRRLREITDEVFPRAIYHLPSTMPYGRAVQLSVPVAVL